MGCSVKANWRGMFFEPAHETHQLRKRKRRFELSLHRGHVQSRISDPSCQRTRRHRPGAPRPARLPARLSHFDPQPGHIALDRIPGLEPCLHQLRTLCSDLDQLVEEPRRLLRV